MLEKLCVQQITQIDQTEMTTTFPNRVVGRVPMKVPRPITGPNRLVAKPLVW